MQRNADHQCPTTPAAPWPALIGAVRLSFMEWCREQYAAALIMGTVLVLGAQIVFGAGLVIGVFSYDFLQDSTIIERGEHGMGGPSAFVEVQRSELNDGSLHIDFRGVHTGEALYVTRQRGGACTGFHPAQQMITIDPPTILPMGDSSKDFLMHGDIIPIASDSRTGVVVDYTDKMTCHTF